MIFPPELAAGWMCARLTTKFQRPITVGLAAVWVQLMPSISQMKVSPLVTGLAADKQTKQNLRKHRQKLEQSIPQIKPLLEKATRAGKWLQGPIDQYGLAMYLSGRLSFISVMTISSYGIYQGMDIQSILSNWGIQQEIGGALGTIAISSAMNVIFIPIHFYSVVIGVQTMEHIAHLVQQQAPPGWQEQYYKEREEKQRQRQQTQNNDNNENQQEDDNKENNSSSTAEEELEAGVMRFFTLLLMMYMIPVTIYTIKLMNENVTKPSSTLSDNTDDIDDDAVADSSTEIQNCSMKPNETNNGEIV